MAPSVLGHTTKVWSPHAANDKASLRDQSGIEVFIAHEEIPLGIQASAGTMRDRNELCRCSQRWRRVRDHQHQAQDIIFVGYKAATSHQNVTLLRIVDLDDEAGMRVACGARWEVKPNEISRLDRFRQRLGQ